MRLKPLALVLFAILALSFLPVVAMQAAQALSAVTFTTQATVTSDSTTQFRKVYSDGDGAVHFLDVNGGSISQDSYNVTAGTASSFSNPVLTEIARLNPDSVVASNNTSAEFYDNIANTNLELLRNGGFTIIAQKVATTDSFLYDKAVNNVTVHLSKNGSPTGTATIGVFDSSGNTLFTFGTQDVTALTTSRVAHTYTASSLHTLELDQYVGVKYAGGSVGNDVEVWLTETSSYDSTDSILSYFSGSWSSADTDDDLSGIVSGISIANATYADANDDNAATFWRSAADQVGQTEFLYADMSSPKEIAEVQLYHNNASEIPASVDLYVTNDTGDFGTALQTFALDNATGFQSLTLDAPVLGQYVKVQVNTWGTTADRWSVAEFDVKAVHEAASDVHVSDVETDLDFWGIGRNATLGHNVVSRFNFDTAGQLANATLDSELAPAGSIAQSTGRLYIPLANATATNGELWLGTLPKEYGTLDKADLQGLYTFDGNASDSGPLDNDLIENGSPTFVDDGLQGQAIAFDGSTQYLTAANNGVYDVATEDFWMAGMFKRTSDSGTSETIAAKRNWGSPSNPGYRAWVGSNDKLIAEIGDGDGSVPAVVVDATISVGVWYAWGTNYDRDGNLTAYLYNLDTATLESASTSITGSAGSLTNTQTFTVARNSQNSANFFPGHMDNLIPPQIGQTLTEAQFLSLVYAEFEIYEGTGSVPVDESRPIRSVVQNDGSSETVYTFFAADATDIRVARFESDTQNATLLGTVINATSTSNYQVVPLDGKILVQTDSGFYELDTSDDGITQVHPNTFPTRYLQPFDVSTSARTYSSNPVFVGNATYATSYDPGTGMESRIGVLIDTVTNSTETLETYDSAKYYYLPQNDLLIEATSASDTSWEILSLGVRNQIAVTPYTEKIDVDLIQNNTIFDLDTIKFVCDNGLFVVELQYIAIGDDSDCGDWLILDDSASTIGRTLPYTRSKEVVHADEYTHYNIHLFASEASDFSATIKYDGRDVDYNTFDSADNAMIRMQYGQCYSLVLTEILSSEVVQSEVLCADDIFEKDVLLSEVLGFTFWSSPWGITHNYNATSNDLDTFVRHESSPYNYTVTITNNTDSAIVNSTFLSADETDIQSFNLTDFSGEPFLLEIFDDGGARRYQAYLDNTPAFLSEIRVVFEDIEFEGWNILMFLPIIFAAMFTRNTAGIGIGVTIAFIGLISWFGLVPIEDTVMWFITVVGVLGVLAYRIMHQ